MSSMASAQSLAERNGIIAPPVRGQLLKGLSDDVTSVETLTWDANGGALLLPLYRARRRPRNTAAGLSLPETLGQDYKRTECATRGYPLF